MTGKWLGLVGRSNIGSIVPNRSLGVETRVLGHSPYLSAENAMRLGIEKVALDEVPSRVDVISVRAPLTDTTRNIISADI